MQKAKNTKKGGRPRQEPEAKAKLRTAAEVINRLRWQVDDEGKGSTPTAQNTLMGYHCRINGPMERGVCDYTPIDIGGDIPEHRIQYFRKMGDDNDGSAPGTSILWDRSGRVDRLFGSGAGASAPISPETMEQVSQAIVTMKRLEEEREIRAKEKAKKKAQARAKKLAVATAANQKLASRQAQTSLSPERRTGNGGSADNNQESPEFDIHDRHTWKPLPGFYVFSSKEQSWIHGGGGIKRGVPPQPKSGAHNCLKAATWNVLFDVHEEETLVGESDSTRGRWLVLLDCLRQSKAEIIALQEVTPRFLEMLESEQWVREVYACSANTDGVHGSVTPHGNLMLWRRDLFRPLELFVCMDQHRSRAIVVSLQHKHDPSTVFHVANVHLPADARLEEEEQQRTDRTIARKRELGAIIAKLQMMEAATEHNKKIKSVPLILGDFNCDDELLPGEYFVDAWENESEAGLTYDWGRNPRAAKGKCHKESRRIDRIYIGKGIGGEDNSSQDFVPLLVVSKSELLGIFEGSSLPPSDHYGVFTAITITDPKKRLAVPRRSLHVDGYIGLNAWATTAIPSTQSILALVVDPLSSDVMGTKLYDPSSTLPLAHITVLYGFAELDSHETRYLATQAVEEVVRDTLISEDMSTEWCIPLDTKSLSVFEHRDSATIVGIPDLKSDKSQWLIRLYETFKATFPQCSEQESRFAGGWMPHFSLGTYGTVGAAREVMNKKLSSGGWLRSGEALVKVRAIGLYRRHLSDGAFYSVAAVPLAQKRYKEIQPRDTGLFLSEAGISWSSYMQGISSTVLWDVERACQHVTMIDERGSGGIDVKLKVYGSHALNSSLPGISDLDAIVQLKPLLPSSNAVRTLSCSRYLQDVASRLISLYRDAKVRMRVAGANGIALHVLTVKLSSQAPALDILLCRCDASGNPLDVSSQTALDAVRDFESLLGYVKRAPDALNLAGSFDFCEIFQAALRIIKLWAVRRQVYGASTGFLGGGGWAVCLARAMYDGLSNGSLVIPPDCDDIGQTASNIALHFLATASSSWPRPMVVTLDGGAEMSPHLDGIVQEATNTVNDRDTMAVLAPVSGGNFARFSTRSTTQATMDEVQRAAHLLEASGRDNTVELFSPLSLDHILTPSCSVLLLEVVTKSTEGEPTRPAEIKGWGATQALALAVKLERVIGDASKIRPLSKPIKASGSFFFVIRVSHCGSSHEWIEIVKKQESQLDAARLAAFPFNEVCIHTLTAQEALEILNPN